jgi:cobalt-zinc-cadmium efflux system outer membrane protein
MPCFPTVRAVVLVAMLFAAADLRATTVTRDFTLDEAIARVEKSHPDLRVFVETERMLVAERDQAGLKPSMALGASIENIAGTGEYAGLGAAEATLTLASVLERGGKRSARQAVAVSRIDALATRRETRRLDLLAEVVRRYLDLVATQARLAVVEADIEQRERTVAAAQRRVRAGASPASTALTAKAALARARMSREQTVMSRDAAWRRLAVLWGDLEPGDAPDVAGDPLSFAPVPDATALRKLLDSTPAIRAFADEQRIRQARLELARSARVPDVEWQVGVRRLQAERDWGLIGSVSIPLGSANRAEPGIRAAEAELAALDIEREGADLALEATLVDALARYRAAAEQARRYEEVLLPALAEAAVSAERTWRAGALSHLEWSQLQSEITAARREQLDVAIEGQRALIEIQRLTAEPFVLTGRENAETTP